MEEVRPFEQYLRPKASLRFRLDATQDGVLIEDTRTREQFRLTLLGAAALAAFAGGRDVREAVGAIAGLGSIDLADVSAVVSDLAGNGLLEAVRPSPSTAMESEWLARGWRTAYDFHCATDDLPFLDYETEGYMVDRTRMNAYRAAEPDPVINLRERVRTTEPRRSSRLNEIASRLAEPVPSATPKVPTAQLTDALLHEVASLSLAFSCHGRKLRRTSPSGGARHPTEGFLASLDGHRITPGLFEYDSVEDELRPIGEPPDAALLSGFFSPYSPFEPQAIFLLYSTFYRNMYRYREPRTFRSVLMDAGHIAATIEAVAHGFGLVSHVHHAVSEDDLDEALGVKLLDRGFIIGVGLSGRG